MDTNSHPPRTRLATAVLRELAKITEAQMGWDHPGVPSHAVEAGTFAGNGHLDIDERGNVILVRVAADEGHLLKGGLPATPGEMWTASEFSGARHPPGRCQHPHWAPRG